MRRQAAEAKTNSGFTNGIRAGAFSESLPQRCGFGLALQGLARGRSPRALPEALGARLRSNFLRIPAAEAPGQPASARRRRCRRRVGSGARSPSSARWQPPKKGGTKSAQLFFLFAARGLKPGMPRKVAKGSDMKLFPPGKAKRKRKRRNPEPEPGQLQSKGLRAAAEGGP